MEMKKIVFGDFRGINNTAPPYSLTFSELLYALNVYVDKNGNLTTRGGFRKLFDTPAGVIGLAVYDGVFYLACKDGKVYKYTHTGGFTHIANHNSTDRVYFQKFGDYILIVDGSEVKYYHLPSGTTGTINQLLYHTQVIGTGNGTQTSFSDTLLEVTITPSTVKVYVNSTLVGQDDGLGEIVGTGVSGTVNYENGAITVNFATPPANGSEIKVIYSASDVLDVRGRYVLVVNDVLYVAYGSYIYYLERPRDLTRWLYIGIDLWSEGEITGIKTIYSDIIVSKGASIYRLSGTGEDVSVTRIANSVGFKHDACVNFLSDLIFVNEDGIYTLSTVKEWGDIKPSKANNNFRNQQVDLVFFLSPEVCVCVGIGQNKTASFMVSPYTAFSCTYFYSPLDILSFYRGGDTLYIGAEDGCYVYDERFDKDGDTANEFYVMFRPIVDGYNRFVVFRHWLELLPITPGSYELLIEKDAEGYRQVLANTFSWLAHWNIASWDVGEWSDQQTYIRAKRQTVSGYSLVFLLRLFGLAKVRYFTLEGYSVKS